METMASPYKTPIDNPSRQLLHELSRLSLVMHDDFYERLDKENKLREADHRNALASAAAEHSRIRRSAEIEREKLELQLDAERRRREAEETRELEKRRQEKADRDAEERREAARKRQEKVDRDVAENRREYELAELQRRRIAEEQKVEEAKRTKKDQDDAELKRRLKAVQDAEAQKKVEQINQASAHGPQRQQQSTQHLPTNLQNSISQPRTTPLVPGDPKAEAEHEKYVEIHRNLKKLREMVKQGVQHDSNLKERIGGMRREIKKCVGQLISGKGANKAPASFQPFLHEHQLMIHTAPSTHFNFPRLSSTWRTKSGHPHVSCLPARVHELQRSCLLILLPEYICQSRYLSIH